MVASASSGFGVLGETKNAAQESVEPISHGDCVEQMMSLPVECIDLAFADPPFNIGYGLRRVRRQPREPRLSRLVVFVDRRGASGAEIVGTFLASHRR